MSMQIFVRTHSTGKTMTLDVCPYDTIQNVKLQIHNVKQIPPSKRLKLVFNIFSEYELEDDNTLNDCNIKPSSMIHLVVEDLPQPNPSSVILPKPQNNNPYRYNNNWEVDLYNRGVRGAYRGAYSGAYRGAYNTGNRGGYNIGRAGYRGGYRGAYNSGQYSRYNSGNRGGGGYRGGYSSNKMGYTGGYNINTNNYVAGSDDKSLDNSIIDHKTDVKNREDLLLKNSNDNKIIMNKIWEQMTFLNGKIIEQDKQITELKEIKLVNDNKCKIEYFEHLHETELREIENKLGQWLFIIDGYIRECYKESQSHFNSRVLTRLVAYFYPHMTDNETTSKNKNIPDVDVWQQIKKKQTKAKHLDVENESRYLMIQNVGIDIRNKQYSDINKHISTFLFNIRCELDEIFELKLQYDEYNPAHLNFNEFQLKYDENRAHLYAQLKMSSETACKLAILRAEQYVLSARKEQKEIEMKWRVKQWCNYKNRGKILAKKHKVKTLKNKSICKNKPQNTNISGALPNQMSTNILPLNNYSLQAVIPGINYQSSAYRYQLPNNIQPIYYNSNNQ